MNGPKCDGDAPGGLAQKLIVPLGDERELIILVYKGRIDFFLSEEGGKFKSFVRFEPPSPEDTRR